MDDELNSAVLGLMLPCEHSREAELLEWFQGELAKIADTQAEQTAWLRAQQHQWLINEEPQNAFKVLVQRAIFQQGREPQTFMFADAPENSPRALAAKCLAAQYFKIHKRVRSQFLMGFDEARQFISYSSYLIDLAVAQRMSASEISRVLGARDRRYGLQWRAIRYLLERCKVAPVISLEAFEHEYSKESLAEPDLLADLTLDEAVGYVANIGRTVGLDADLAPDLAVLLLESSHEPYLCILHYQLMSLSFCDHAVTYAYEFSPRGQNAASLMQKYNEAGVPVAKNAFLNNAKALLRFDATWVDGRAENRKPAASLAAVLGQLETMGALAKRQAARFILAALHRNLRISEERKGVGLANELVGLTETGWNSLLDAISSKGSGTNGIIEQRIVDCVGDVRHRDDWVPRGLGDSVFAPSIFRNKLGDVEFIKSKASPPEVVAYESHGGHLTAVYVEDHFDTFFQVLEKRSTEFENVTSLADWSLKVVFVAHSFSPGLPVELPRETNDGPLKVTIEYQSFTDLADELRQTLDERERINAILIEPLNQYHVHPRVRRRLIELSR
jgi:hypothetical protein